MFLKKIIEINCIKTGSYNYMWLTRLSSSVEWRSCRLGWYLKAVTPRAAVSRAPSDQRWHDNNVAYIYRSEQVVVGGCMSDTICQSPFKTTIIEQCSLLECLSNRVIVFNCMRIWHVQKDWLHQMLLWESSWTSDISLDLYLEFEYIFLSVIIDCYQGCSGG